jgi:hypothetical protein
MFHQKKAALWPHIKNQALDRALFTCIEFQMNPLSIEKNIIEFVII